MSRVPFTEEEENILSNAIAGINLASGSVIVGNASGLAKAVAVSGDMTISNAGVANIPVAGGLFSSVASSEVETLSVNAGAISTTILQSDIVTAGAETRTIAAPSVKGQLKIIFFKTDGGDCTIAGTNIYNNTATTLTLNDAGDSAVLYAPDTTRWVVVGLNGCAFA